MNCNETKSWLVNAASVVTAVLLVGCGVGHIDDPLNPQEDDGDLLVLPDGTAGPGGRTGPGSPTDPFDDDPFDDEDGDEDTLPAPATIGSWCGPGIETTHWLVVSSEASCSADAEHIGGTLDTGHLRVSLTDVQIAVGTVRTPGTYCDGAGCEELETTLVFDRVMFGDSVSGRWSVNREGLTIGGGFVARWCDFDHHLPPHPEAELLAEDIAVDDVSFYQVVKVNVVENGREVGDRNAPIVADKPALVRVFVEPEPGFAPRQITARLTVSAPNQDPLVQTVEQQVSGASREEDGQSTFNFDVPADYIGIGTTWSVALVDQPSGCRPDATVGSSAARFPESGQAQLNARRTGTLRVRFVPIRYEADGSNRVPDTSAARLEEYRRELIKLFPAADIDISVREEGGWPQPVLRDGQGWSSLLNAVANLRANDGVDSDIYYYALVNPAGSLGNFCQGGCVAGVAPTPGPNESVLRVGLGLGFGDGGTAEETFVHELAHAHGRLHAPCGATEGVDRNYPYSGGRIGVWGYDYDAGRLHSPDSRTDFMGYCNPTWVSDYTYSALVERISHVNGVADVINSGDDEGGDSDPGFRTVVVETDGTVYDGGALVAPTTGSPAARRFANLIDASGLPLATINVYQYDLPDVGGKLILVPDTPTSRNADIDLPGVAAFRLNNLLMAPTIR